MVGLDCVNALFDVLSELIDGSAPDAAWVLNPEDPGLLTSLNSLSAEQASVVPPGGTASIAAHVDHLRYGLELLNRLSNGDDPFTDADYGASWERCTVSEAEWASRRETLRREAYAWRESISRQRDLTNSELTAIVASVAHLAYHLGAIRQIDRSTRGPSARDSIRITSSRRSCMFCMLDDLSRTMSAGGTFIPANGD
jgi:hypothetical protein